MKLKKEIATLLLASTLLTAPLTACQQTPDGGDEIDNTTPEITTPQTPPSKVPSSPFDKYQRDNYVLRESFINEQVGYTFVFDGAHFVALFKTTDGGKTWGQQTVNGAPDHNWNEDISCAKMLDENIGCIFVAHRADDCVSSRTHITTDGGKTWTQVILPPDGPYVTKPDSNEFVTYAASTAAYDFFYEDGKYIICFAQKGYADIHFQYSSTDLKKWTFEQTFDASLCTGTWYDSQMPPNELEISSVSEGKIECHLRVLQLDAFDDFDLTVTLQDGKYIFTDKNELISGTIQFKEDSILVVVEQSNTDDLQSGDSWSFTIKDTIVYTLYSLSDSDGSDKVVCKYEYSKSGSMVYLQIDAWNQTLVLPFTFKHIVEIKFAPLAATIVGDKGFFVYHPDHSETSIKILSFTKGSDEITEQTITWDTAICQNQIFCNFIDDENGYIFVTEEIDAPGFSRGAEKVSKLYKTQDGGKTWDSLNCDNIPYISLRESLVLAKFVTEDIAIIAGRIGATDCNLHERTYITQDGGLTWNPILLPYPLNGEWDYSEVVDMVLIDDCYYLTVKSSGNNRKEMQFWSKNLTNWMLVPNSENDLGPNQSISSVLYENDGKVYLQIGAWNQTLEFPFTYTEIKDLEFSNATAIFGDKGIFVYHPDGLGTSIKILSFAEGSDEITEQTITWDEPIYENQIFCNFVDDKNGYIFVIEEGGHSDFAYGYQKVSKLYKTQDGGKTWTSVDCSNAPYTNLRECMILAKFATEDIGIIAGRHWASDYSFHKRTYITKDGGISWIPVDLSNFFAISPDKDWGIQAYDLQYIDGTYYLYVQAVHEGTGKPCYLFTSSDGVEWNYLKQVN